MIASPVERFEWSDDNVARELEDLVMRELGYRDFEAPPEGGLEDEVTDDEIARAAEELATDPW